MNEAARTTVRVAVGGRVVIPAKIRKMAGLVEPGGSPVGFPRLELETGGQDGR